MSASAARVNTALTTYAFGLTQDVKMGSVAQSLAPLVRVGSGSYQFKRYNTANDFQLYNTARAMGGKPMRIEFAADDPTSVVKPHALETTIDDQERKNSADNGVSLERAKVRSVYTNFMLAREKRILTYVEANTTAVSGAGVWSSSSVDPITELDAEIERINNTAGQMPNQLALGVSAWKIIKNHPKVLSRFPGANIQNVTLAQLASLLLNPNIQINLGTISYSTTKLGGTKNAVSVIGAKVYVYLSSTTPTQEDPSWFKSFSTGDGNISGVRQYREEPFNDVFLVDMDDDIQLISAECGSRIDLS